MKTYNQWVKWSVSEGKKERDEELDQLTHDITMDLLKKNADRVGSLIFKQLEKNGIPDDEEKEESNG